MEDKLWLRPYKKSDGRFLRNWLINERQMRMWCREHFSYPLTEEEINGYYHELEEDERSWGFTAIDQSGTPVGSLRMTRADYEAKSIHFSFIVIDSNKRGQGLGEEMVSLAVAYALDFLGMERITLKVFDNNPGARRCYEKTGFQTESYNKEDYVFDQEKWGCYLMVYTVKD